MVIVALSVWGLDVDISLWGHHSIHCSMPGRNRRVLIRHFGILLTTPSPAEGRGGSSRWNLEPIAVVRDWGGNTPWKLEPITAVRTGQKDLSAV